MLISEEEKNRIRVLHGTQVLNEAYEGMDASDIDAENLSDKEEDWTADWDELDDEIKNVYRKHKEFEGMDESAIKEKFNAMGPRPLCKILRFLFGWLKTLLLSPFDKEMRGGMGGPGYKAWNCGRRRR